MATRIFLSNKDTWGNDIETAINEAKEAFAADESDCCRTWTCRNVRAIQVGDKAYFKRVGSEPRGFFARGRVVAAEKEYQLRLTASEYEELSEAYDIEVYNGQLIITYEWDSVVDYDKPLEISWLKNKPEFNGAFFDFLGSGGSFREEYVELLDRRWEKHVLTMSSLGHGARRSESKERKPTETNSWIQYHDYEQMGGLPEGLPGCDRETGISTNQRSALHAKGDVLFLIVGIGDPKRYYLWSKFVVERIKRVVCELGGFTYNAFGNEWVLNPPQLLNSEKFYELKHFCRNFELESIRINNSPYLETLKYLAEKYKPQSSDSHSWKGTEKFYNYVLRINPSDAYAYSCQGLIHDRLGDTQRAIEEYSQAIRIAPDFADAYNHRGLAYFGLGNLEEAIQDCSQAIRLAPDFADAYHNRGLIRYIQGDKQGAIEDYKGETSI